MRVPTMMGRMQVVAAVMTAAGLAAGTAWLASSRVAAAQAPAAGAQPTASGLTRDQLLAELSKPAAEPANVAEGRKMFEALCSTCHLFGGIGKSVGPDLTSVASRFRSSDIADAVLFPSKTISDQYVAEVIITKTGDIHSGIVQRETALSVFLITPGSPDRPVAVPVNAIEERRKATTSLMPEGLFDAFTVPQMRNVIGFLLAPPPAQ